jgi:hypothetical protein
MATQWYCKIMGDEQGPMSARQLQSITRSGRLAIDDLVRKHSDGIWVRAENVIGLFDRPTLPVVVKESIAVIDGLGSSAKRQPTQGMSAVAGQLCSIELRATDSRVSLCWSAASGPRDEPGAAARDRTSCVVVPRRTLKVATGARAAAVAEKLANQTTLAAGFSSLADTVASTSREPVAAELAEHRG